MRTVRRALAVVLVTTGSTLVMALIPASLRAFPANGGSEPSRFRGPPGLRPERRQPPAAGWTPR